MVKYLTINFVGVVKKIIEIIVIDKLDFFGVKNVKIDVSINDVFKLVKYVDKKFFDKDI